MVIEEGYHLTVMCSEAEPEMVPYGSGKMLLVKARASTPMEGMNICRKSVGSWAYSSGSMGNRADGVAERNSCRLTRSGGCLSVDANSRWQKSADRSWTVSADDWGPKGGGGGDEEQRGVMVTGR